MIDFLNLKILKYFLIPCFILFAHLPSQSTAGHSRDKIKLQEALRSELNLLLSATDQLHQACYNQDKIDIEKKTKVLIENINRASKKSVMASVQRTHLVKILEAAKDKLVMSQNFVGPKQKESLQGAFADLVQIAKVFSLDSYRIFFCQKDKSVWLQSNSKPQNPINPQKFGNCGRLVP